MVWSLPAQGGQLTWTVENNFCIRKSKRREALRNFLFSETATTGITTHQAFSHVWKTLSDLERRATVRNTTFRIDEAHHISVGANNLGDFCEFALNCNEDNVRLHLTTATFYRGDNKSIFPKRLIERFSRYRLSWEDWLPVLGIKRLTQEFVTYKDDPIGHVVDNIRSELDRRHLVIVPPKNQKYRTENTVTQLLDRVRGLYARGKVLDLVTQRIQGASKRLLFAIPERFHVVVACRLFDEGTDWAICDRLHNADSCERSMPLAVQRFYRPLRKFDGKDTVIIRDYVPTLAVDNNEAARIVWTDRLNALLATIVTQGEFLPVDVPTRNGRPSKIGLRALLRSNYEKVIRSLIDKYELATDRSVKAVEMLVDEVIEEFEIDCETGDVDLRWALKSVVARIANRGQPIIDAGKVLPGFRCEEIRKKGFDKIMEWSESNRGIVFQSDNLDSEALEELRKVIRQRRIAPGFIDLARDVIKLYWKEGGVRLTARHGYIPELEMEGWMLDRVLRSEGINLKHELRSITGIGKRTHIGCPSVSLKEVHRVIQMYSRRGERISGDMAIPELGLRSPALSNQLKKYYGTTLAREVTKITGVESRSGPKKSAPTVEEREEYRRILKNYWQRGDVIRNTHGYIPELGVRGQGLEQRLRKRFGSTIAREMQQILDEAGCNEDVA